MKINWINKILCYLFQLLLEIFCHMLHQENCNMCLDCLKCSFHELMVRECFSVFSTMKITTLILFDFYCCCATSFKALRQYTTCLNLNQCSCNSQPIHPKHCNCKSSTPTGTFHNIIFCHLPRNSCSSFVIIFYENVYLNLIGTYLFLSWDPIIHWTLQ